MFDSNAAVYKRTAGSSAIELGERSAERARFLADVVSGLSRAGQKELPCHYLYDDLGSALFEAITLLPEYGLTRADERLLERHARSLLPHLGGLPLVSELGSGSGRKTRHVLCALRERAGDQALTYAPIDISQAALEQCEKELAPFARVIPLRGSYLDGVAQASRLREPGQPLLVLFLGSTIGNFARQPAKDFLTSLRGHLVPGDVLLLGVDLLKTIDQMLLAYDDPTGVTAAFNLNLLGRINRTLDGDFNLRRFRHQARYNPLERRVEMHLESLVDQEVVIGAAPLRIRFHAGETLFTESSYKYTAQEIAELAATAGFRCTEQWIDSEWPFAESVCMAC
ncbi:MAG: L-histidine N(alpha)-methyltransferase [Polyangia bacterium]